MRLKNMILPCILHPKAENPMGSLCRRREGCASTGKALSGDREYAGRRCSGDPEEIEILPVGINYDKKTARHECLIEKHITSEKRYSP